MSEPPNAWRISRAVEIAKAVGTKPAAKIATIVLDAQRRPLEWRVGPPLRNAFCVKTIMALWLETLLKLVWLHLLVFLL